LDVHAVKCIGSPSLSLRDIEQAEIKKLQLIRTVGWKITENNAKPMPNIGRALVQQEDSWPVVAIPRATLGQFREEFDLEP
jgi:hypothetical protein